MGTFAAQARLRAGVPYAMPCSTVPPTSTRVRVGLCALAALALSAQGAFAAEGASMQTQTARQTHPQRMALPLAEAALRLIADKNS
jgi:hypothetical protein